jgi:hypothetical protein
MGGTLYRDVIIGGKIRIGDRETCYELDIDALIAEGFATEVTDEEDGS